MNTKKYWRGLEELNPTKEFEQNLKMEFSEDLPMPAAELVQLQDAPTSRRDFLKYLGFSTAAATLAASCEVPVRKAIPYAIKPENVTPGVALYYASTFIDGGNAIPALVKVRDGRPIKIEGNKDSKLFEGATGARMQASVLNLYDIARLQYPKIGGKKASWSDADKQVTDGLAKGGNVYLVSSTINGPLNRDVISSFVSKYNAKHVMYDAVSYSGLLKANGGSIPMYRFDQAKAIISIGADFLGTWLTPELFSKQYSKTRKVQKGSVDISKHIQFEGIMSLSGANSDERYPCRPSEYGKIAAAIYGALSGGSSTTGNPALDAGVKSAVSALQNANGNALVVSGSNDPNVQTLVNAINSQIGANGTTISGTANLTKQGNDADMDEFIQALKGGQVSGVVFLDCNPVYELPNGKAIAEKLKNVNLSVALADRMDETASVCKIVAPVHHFLESWGDAEPFSGHVSLIQPTINPLFDTRQWQESLLKWGGAEQSNFGEYFKTYYGGKLGGQKALDETLQFGLMEPEELGSGGASIGGDVSAALAAINAVKGGGVELEVYSTIALGAGGNWGNNPWLQEMPDPITKCTWDNYVVMSYNRAKKMGAELTDLNEVQRGKKVFSIQTKNEHTDLPVVVVPGMHDDVIGIPFGYGRAESVGMAANGTGKSVSQFVTYDSTNGVNTYYASNVDLKNTGKTYDLAIVQTHHSYEGRPILFEFTKEEFEKNPDELYNHRKGHLEHYTHKWGEAHDEHGHGEHGDEQKHAKTETHVNEAEKWQKDYYDNGTLYEMEQHPQDGIKWGMSIDLNACTGCSACTIACQAENNVSVVGKEQVKLVHDMYWLRIDRYFSGDPSKPESIQTVFQPMLCQHCDNAPCENVCPVNATNHSSEGLNQMAYNRCIGTRYCANNCPFKVRRFNWRDWNEADSFVRNTFHDGRRDDINNNITRMVLNPDVTVRSRGVMEKCSFCVQRLQEAKRAARVEGRVMADGEATTACQTACPTHAIVFGNVNDKESEIYKLRFESQKERVFYALEEIHVLPNINYLSKIRNTDKIAGRVEHGHENHNTENHKPTHG